MSLPVSPSDIEPSAAPPAPGKSWLRDVLETILLTALIYAGVNFATGRFRVESVSMHPTLEAGQYVLVEKITYMLGAPQRGDVVVFHDATGANRDLIKRVIGLPGETVDVSGGVVRINGTPLEEPYIAAGPAYQGTWTLGPEQYFVLGDNRNSSSDSHIWGPLDRDRFIGHAVLVYWPPTVWALVPSHTYASSN